MVVKIILSILLLIAMIFLMTSGEGSVKAVQEKQIEFYEELELITDEICGLEHDMYRQQTINEDIIEKLEEK